MILIALAAASLAAPQDGRPRLALAQTIEPGFEIAAHRWIDVDGDLKAELVVFGRNGDVRTFAQAAKPVGALRLADPSHALVDLARLQGERGPAQLVCATPSGVDVYALDGEKAFSAQAATRVPRARFTLRAGRPTLADLAQDVNTDGRPDLVMPGAEACELWLNEGLPPATGAGPAAWPTWRKTATVAVDLDGSHARGHDRLSDVLASSFTIPALSTRDVNGDGRPDLLVEEGDRRGFHLQREDGSFPAKPDVTVDLAIFRDSTEEAQIRPGHTLAIDTSASFKARDLDGDGIPDYVIAHRRKVWVFRGGKQGPQFADPFAILKAADDITALQLVRLDGDPHPDLLLVKVQVPTIATLVRGVFGEWDVDVAAAGYLNRGGKGFENSPSLKRELVLRLPSILSLMKQPEKVLERFEGVRDRFRESVWGDFDGSGTRDVALVSSDSSALEVWTVDKSADADPATLDGEEMLRRLLFEDQDEVWTIDRVVLWLGDLAERRTAMLTGGRPAEGRLELRDKEKALLASLECADVDGDGREEVLLRYELRDPARTVFDVLRWK